MHLNSLVSALGPRPRLAIVGAGGKSSLLFRLASAYGRVLLSNSAHLSLQQSQWADHCVTIASTVDVPEDVSGGVTLLTGPADARGRSLGLDEASLESVFALAERLNLPLLIEADGSRGLPLKAPAPWEPPIPAWVTEVVVTAGLSGLGKALDSTTVYRPEEFAALSGLGLGESISVTGLARVLAHPQGGQKNIPSAARRFVLLNQADDPALRAQACDLARLLLPIFDGVAVSSLHGGDPNGPAALVHALCRPTAGIVLAAGESRRMGQPKQLMAWQGEALVRRAAQTALEGGLDPVLVVTGAYAAQVQAALAGLPVQVVYNPDWAAGQSTSLRAGLAALPERVSAAVFLLADQPYVTADLVDAVARRYAETLVPVVAPRAGGGKRANPVLFDRRTFPDLFALQGDTGGRQVIERFTVEYVDWPDECILLDMDTPQDFTGLDTESGFPWSRP